MSGETGGDKLLADAKKAIFAGYLAQGLTVIKASSLAGVHPQTGYRWRDDPEVLDELRRLRAETRPRIIRGLNDLADTALGIYREAMNLERPAAIPTVALAAAKDTLDRLGLTPKELGEYLGHPDDTVTIVVPVPLVGDPRAEQEQRRQDRLARVSEMPTQRPDRQIGA